MQNDDLSQISAADIEAVMDQMPQYDVRFDKKTCKLLWFAKNQAAKDMEKRNAEQDS